jgi:Fe2+ transport system protein FeoA
LANHLANTKNGASVSIISIDTAEFKVKLMEMGLTEGSTVKVLYRAPFGDPIAIDIKGYVLSLRKSEAALIQVEPINEFVS